MNKLMFDYYVEQIDEQRLNESEQRLIKKIKQVSEDRKYKRVKSPRHFDKDKFNLSLEEAK